MSRYPKVVRCPITGIVAVMYNAKDEAEWDRTTQHGLIAVAVVLALALVSFIAAVA